MIAMKFWKTCLVTTALLSPMCVGGAEKAAKLEQEAVVKPHHWQEGEVLELDGRLELSGDRAIFYPPQGEPLRVLENLALERVTRVLTESPSDRLWLVSGVVTEYRGSNYLLITKAIRRAVREKPVKP